MRRLLRNRGYRALLVGTFALAAWAGSSPALASGLPTGERVHGQVAVEPAYDDVSVAPLYLVEYPPSYPGWTLNCMGVPGNCPDHDGLVAGVAVQAEPTVYGTDASAVPGHDHLVAGPASHGDFNVAWEVTEVVFTNPTAANNHLTTETAIESAEAAGDVIEIDLGFAFHCSVVPASAY